MYLFKQQNTTFVHSEMCLHSLGFSVGRMLGKCISDPTQCDLLQLFASKCSEMKTEILKNPFGVFSSIESRDHMLPRCKTDCDALALDNILSSTSLVSVNNKKLRKFVSNRDSIYSYRPFTNRLQCNYNRSRKKGWKP